MFDYTDEDAALLLATEQAERNSPATSTPSPYAMSFEDRQKEDFALDALQNDAAVEENRALDLMWDESVANFPGEQERRKQAELDARYMFRNKSRDPQQPAPAEEPSNRPFTPSELIPQGEARPDELLKESLNEAAGEGRKKLDFAERTGLRPVLKPLEQPKTESDRKLMDALEKQTMFQRMRKHKIDDRVRSGGEVRGFERFTRMIDDLPPEAPPGYAPTLFDVPVLTKIPGFGQVIALGNSIKEHYVKKRIKQNAYSDDALGQAMREADIAIVQADEAFDSELQKRGASWRSDVAAGIGNSAVWIADAMIAGPTKSLIKYGSSARWAERIVPHLATAGRRGVFHIPAALADALDRMQAKGLQVTPEGKAFFEHEGEGWLKAFSKAIATEAVEQLSEASGEMVFGPMGNALARNLPASQRLVRMFLGTLDDPKTLAQNPSMLSNVISGLFPEWLEERASSFGHAIFNLDERPGVELTTKERWQVFPATWREAGIELGVIATITGATAAGGIGPALERHAKAVRRTQNADKYRAIHHELLNVDTSNISDRDTELMKRAEWAIGAGQQRVVADAVELMSEPARAVWNQMTFNAEVKLARTNAARKILPEVKPFTSPETTDMQRNESTGQNEYTDINSRMKIVETVPGKQFMVQNVEGEDIATTETLAGAEAVARDYVARRMAREVVGFQRETMTMGVNGETVIDAYKDESSGVAYQVNNTTGKATVFDENGKAVATDLTPADARKKATEIALQQQDVDIEEEVNRETRDARARLAAQIASNMIEGAEVVMFESHEELLGRPDHEIPAIVKERIRGDYAQRTPAFVYEDRTTGKSTVFIALDAVGNGFDMIEALSHETGHYGVGMKMVAGEAMGDTTKTLNDFLQEISGEHGLEILDDKVREIMADDAMLQDLEESLIQRHRDAAIRRLRARKDLSREQRAAQAQAIQQHDFDVSGEMTLRVLEEAIVEIQEGIGISADSYDRFVNALHKRINKTGSMMNKTFGTNLGLQAKMTRADLKVFLDNARKAARKGPEGFKRNDKEYSVKLYEKRKSPEERRTERKAQAAQNRAQGAWQAGVAPAAANGETPAAGTPAKPSDVSDGTVKNKRARQNAITPEQDADSLADPFPIKPNMEVTKVEDIHNNYEKLMQWKKDVAAWADKAPRVLPFIFTYDESSRPELVGKGTVKVVHANTRNTENPWRYSSFSHKNGVVDMTPNGHSEFKTKGEAVVEAMSAPGTKYDPDIRFRRAETPEFKRWFRDSKVVDADGKPLMVYHGTMRGGFTVFNTDGGGKTAGTGAFFTTSNRGASTYSGTMDEVELHTDAEVEAWWNDEGGANEETPFSELTPQQKDEARSRYDDEMARYDERSGNYPVYLSLQNPKIIDAEGRNWDSIGAAYEWYAMNEDGEFVEYFGNEEDANHFRDTSDEAIEIERAIDETTGASTDDLARQAREEGYDGVIIKNVTDEGGFGQGYGWDSTIYVAFRPEQIKSATANVGTFDPENPDIRFRRVTPKLDAGSISSIIDSRFAPVSRAMGVYISDVPMGINAQSIVNKQGVQIRYNSGRLSDMKITEEQLTAIMREELLHSAVHKAILNNKMDIAQEYVKIFDQMTKEERNLVGMAYAGEQHESVMAEELYAGEFVRMLLQRKLYGQMTEEVYAKSSAVQEVVNLVKLAVQYLKDLVSGLGANAPREMDWIIHEAEQIISSADPESGSIRFKRDRKPTFYSALSRAVESLPANTKAPGDQFLKRLEGLRNKGQAWKTQEAEEAQFLDWVRMQQENGQAVTREAALAFLEGNGVKITDITKSDAVAQKTLSPDVRIEEQDDGKWMLFSDNGEEGPFDSREEAEAFGIQYGYTEVDSSRSENGPKTKYSQYAPPGYVPGTYREVLMTVPDADMARYERIRAQEKRGEKVSREDDLWIEDYELERRHTKEGYVGPHWAEKNVIAHMLMAEWRIPLDVLEKTQPELAARLRAEGKTEARALHMIEGQSDLHAAGQSKGYSGKAEYAKADAEYGRFMDEMIAKYGVGWDDAMSPEDSLRDARLLSARDSASGENGTVPNLPMKGNAWKRLVVRKMLAEAFDGGYDLLTWSTGADRAAKWGSDRVEWKKGARKKVYWSDLAREMFGKEMETLTNDELDALITERDLREKNGGIIDDSAWTVAGTEQSGGEHAGQNLEAVARERGLLLEKSGQPVRTKDELRKIVEGILRNPESGKVDKLTDRIWERMQVEPEGTSMPRREFFEFLYDKSFVNEANDIVRKMDKGAKVGETAINATDRLNAPRTYIGPEKSLVELRTIARTANNATVGMQIRDMVKEMEAGMSFQDAAKGLSITAAKALGGDIEYGTLPGTPAHAIPITDAMRSSIEQGQVLYKRATPAQQPPTGVNVEVAPDPNAEALNERWRALPLAVRDDATRRIASSVLPRMLHEIGIDDIELEYTRGTFEGNYNPTIIMRFTPQATWETKRRAAIASGALLRQQAVIVFDEGITEGDNLGSFFKVVPDRVMTDDEMSALNDGMFADFRAGSGLTLRDGSMVFGNFTGYSDTPMTDEQFRLALNAALDKHIPADVTIDVPMKPAIFRSEYIDELDGAKGADGVVLDETLQKWYGALETKGDAEDASQVSRDDVEAGRDDLRKRIGSFRSIQAEAEAVLNAFIDGTLGADQLAGEAGDAAPDRGGEGGTIRNLRADRKAADRKAVVFHWGREGLTETDPTYQGTGIQGAERKRQFNRPKDYVPRTYFGGAQYAKKPEFPKGTPKYSAEIDTSRIVVLGDLTPEEKKIWARARAAGGGEFAPDSVTFFEKGLKRAGYLGWYDPHDDVYAIFDKVPVKPVGARRVSRTTLKFAKPYSGKKLTLAQLAATAPVAAPAAQTPPAAGMPQQAAAPLPAVSVIQAAAQAAAQAQATPAMPQQPVAGAATMPPTIPQALVPFKQAMHRPNKVLKGPPSQANAIQYIYRGLASLAGNISKDIAILLRSMEQRIGTLDTDFDKAIMPISHRYKKLSEPRGERRAFDSAVMQGEPQNVSAMAAYFGIPDAEYLAVRERLDFIENRARALGLKFGHVDNYWPRKVKDYDGLRLAMEQLYGITSNVIDSALAKAEHEKGAPLTEFEQGDVVAAMAHGNQKSGGLGNLKERKLQFIPDELQDYYEDSMTTAMTYAHAMHEQIAIREFLGKMSPAYRVQVEMAKAWMNDPANQGVTPPPQVTQMLATDFGVGHALLDLHQRGVLDAGDVSKLNQILSSRFAPRHTPVAIRRAMNATMGMFLVQAKSTIRQLQDLHNTVGAAGAFWGTVGIAKAATRNLLRVKPGATYMRLEDLGVSPSDAWKRDSVANKAIEMGFNAIGFSLLDRLGKEALVNAKMSQLRSLATRAQNGSLSAARKLDREVFRLFTGMPSQKVKDRLAATDVHGAPVITDESKQAGYQTLAIYTPISRSEMPLLWQKGGMYGAMYQFKSYLISFHNAWVDMGIRQLKEAGEAGDTAGQAEAIRNMVMMPVYFTTFGFLTSMLIQALFNRDDEPEEVLYGEFLQTLGSNRYMTYKAKVGEWQELLSGFLMPALSPATDLGRDVADVVQGKIEQPLDMRMARSFPGFGSIIYAWYGRGSKEWKSKNDAKRKAEKKGNPRKSGGSKRSKTTLKLLSDD